MTEHSPLGRAPVLQVHPTRHCNLACAHCYTSSGPKAREALALERLTACIDDAVGLGYQQLAVSGGEPLLYPALLELLGHAKARGMLTTLTTNGMLATADRFGPLAPFVELMAISIDGTPADHDEIRRCQGAFGRTVANLAAVRASGVPFGFIFTLTQHNVDSLEFVVRLAAEHGARSVQVHPLTLVGRAAATMLDARPDALELTAALVECERLGAALGVGVHLDAITQEQLVRYRERMVPRRPVARIVDVAPIMIVEADGTVMPMTHELDRRFRLGSLGEAPLPELARRWLERGCGDALAEVCEATWRELAVTRTQPTFYWYEEVANRSHMPVAAGPSVATSSARSLLGG